MQSGTIHGKSGPVVPGGPIAKVASKTLAVVISSSGGTHVNEEANETKQCNRYAHQC